MTIMMGTAGLDGGLAVRIIPRGRWDIGFSNYLQIQYILDLFGVFVTCAFFGHPWAGCPKGHRCR